MAKMKNSSNIIQIDDDEEADILFLAELDAIESHALSLSSSKRRRLSPPPSQQPPIKLEIHDVEEGPYTAALRGSKSLTWQKQLQNKCGRVSTTATATAASELSPRVGGGGACFKCGIDGHWARDCTAAAAAAATGSEVEKRCPCGVGNCLVLTANTERNPGRKFFRCPVRQENGGCGFFEWCDKSSGDQASVQERSWNSSQQSTYQHPVYENKTLSQGTTNYTRSWNDYDKGTSASKSGYGTSQMFETTDNKSHSKTGSCFKCGEEGHWSRDCHASSTNKNVASSRGQPASDTCFKCGQSGHWAKDCSQGQNTKPRMW